MENDWWRQRTERVQQCRNTARYKEEVIYFRQLLSDYENEIRNYIGKESMLAKEVEKQETYMKYGINSRYLHRGALCPSPILHIVTGGTKRGRVIDSYKKKADYQYIYNLRHQLVQVVKLSECTNHEYIQYFDTYDLGVTFDPDGVILEVCRCITNELLQSYEFGLYSQSMNKVTELRKEIYQYENNHIREAEVYFYMRGASLSHEHYVFNPGPDGYAESYRAYELIGDEIMNKDYCDRLYKVSFR